MGIETKLAKLEDEVQYKRTKIFKNITYRPSVVIWRAPPLRLHRQHSCSNKTTSERTEKVCQTFHKKLTTSAMQTVSSHHLALWRYVINPHSQFSFISRRVDAYRCPCVGWAPWARPAFIHQIWTYSITAWKKWNYTQSYANISVVLSYRLFNSRGKGQSQITELNLKEVIHKALRLPQ